MLRVLSTVMFCFSLLVAAPSAAEEPEEDSTTPHWLISSGAFTNLPPGSLVSIAVALERGIEAVKLDLVLSSDDQVMVISDPRLNEITNINQVYSDRARGDGSYLSVDFTRDELQGLKHQSADTRENFTGSATVFTPEFPIISLHDALGYIDMMFAATGHKPAVICELRKGWLHRREGKDLAQSVYRLLEDYRLRSGSAALFLASYDPDELQQLAETRPPAGDAPKFIQIIGTNDGEEVQTLDFGRYQPYNYDLLFTKFGLKAVSTYAAAIGLTPESIFDESATVIHPDYLQDARTLGMEMILYGEAADLQLSKVPGASASSVLDHLFSTVGFDAVLTEDNDLINSWKQRKPENGSGNQQDQTIERLIKQIESGSTRQPSSVQSGTTW